ncbi:HlyD family efflux transporter periplasmic adaptor subunit [Actibacterium sp. MT2.3-13A]|uniref:HlyD family secretion protein n=1 Tax=Actibacterium sp. MT2.3-13A TaxID=2828332 RepID=UPI001BA8E4BE|nr:HlyD family efflux transporter periplasmic adaptor subunit [Actibacterium sp. MT2.3-13A]
MKRIALVVVLGLLAAAGLWVWQRDRAAGLPAGFARGNGRIEAERVDVATKFGGRLQEILVSEGEMVEAGQVLAQLDPTQIEAQLREAEAGVRAARQGLAEARAVLAERKSNLTFAEQELFRAETLGARGYAPGEVVDLRRTQKAAAEAAVASARAGIASARARIEAAQATVDRLRADLAEFALTAPRAGRVQYRLAEPGEVLAAGARVVTLLDLTDVSMTIYLPTAQAGRLAYGAEARLVFDAAPQFVVPAAVSFVASEAQFTPKYVETEEERENLMFRVRLQIPPDVLRAHQEFVKTGVPGVATVRLDPDAEWPADLAVRLPDDG